MKPWKSRRWLKLWGTSYVLLSQGLLILITKSEPPGRIILQKSTVPRPVQKFPHFMDPHKSITVFKTAQHLSLSWGRTMNSKPYLNSFKIHFTITLPSTSGFSNSFPFFRFPHQNRVCTSPLPHKCYMQPPFHHYLFYHQNNFWRGE